METNKIFQPILATLPKWVIAILIVMIIGLAFTSACGGVESTDPAPTPPAAACTVDDGPAMPKGYNHFSFTEETPNGEYTCIVSTFTDTLQRAVSVAQSCWRN